MEWMCSIDQEIYGTGLRGDRGYCWPGILECAGGWKVLEDENEKTCNCGATATATSDLKLED